MSLLEETDLTDNQLQPPVPSEVGGYVPDQSDKWLYGINTTTKIFLDWNRIDAPGSYKVPSDPSQEYFRAFNAGPPAYQIVWRRYWKKLCQSVVQPGQTFKKAISATKGVLETETRYLAQELGVEHEGISAKLSSGFSTSITIESSCTVTTEHEFHNDQSAEVYFGLWQLVDEFSIETTEDVTEPWGKFFKAGSLLSDVMYHDNNGRSPYTSGIIGSDHTGYVSCLQGRFVGRFVNFTDSYVQTQFPPAS